MRVSQLVLGISALVVGHGAVVPHNVDPQFALQQESEATGEQIMAAALKEYGIDDPTEKRIVIYENANEIKMDVISEIDKFGLMRQGIRFQDVTKYVDQYVSLGNAADLDTQGLEIKNEVYFHKYNYPNASDFHEEEVFALIKEIDTVSILEKLSNFTSFYSRYYKSDSGFESQLWLYEQILGLIPESYLPYTDITLFDHESWKQQSIIVTLYGENAKKDDDGKYTDKGPVVVLGAHQDSANAFFPQYLAAPGADDDGSGSITILETLRIILKNEIKFQNTVEFHFYSAEEAGLLGSLDVFNDYKAKGVQVVAMMQQDMTGFVSKTIEKKVPEHLGVTTDYTSDLLYDFVVDIIDKYCLIPAMATKCGYACSDHASALQNGYPAIMAIESAFQYTDPFIHSRSDTVDKLSVTHIAESVKMDLAYVYELGQWADVQEIGATKIQFGTLGYRLRRLFYQHFDAICWFMLVWCTLMTLACVRIVQDIGVKNKLRKLLLRRKYHFLNGI